MATLIKITVLLRDVKVITHKHNFGFINKLWARSLYAVGNSQYYVPKASNHYQNGHFTKSLFGHSPRIHTTSKYLNELPERKMSPNSLDNEKEEKKKLSLFQRFKSMYRDYWYVLLPVHMVTSAFWFGGFYYAAKSGIDIVSFMEKLNFSDAIIEKVKNNPSGYLAIAFALYKIVTPLRYAVTLGGTTVSINYLKKWGYIKPMMKKEELRRYITDQREVLRERRLALKDKMMYKFNQKKS